MLLVQESRDHSSASRRFGEFAYSRGTVEKLPLQFCRQRTPLHDDRRSEAAQHEILVVCDCEVRGRLSIRAVQRLVIVVGEPLFIVRQRGEPLLKRLKITRLARYCGALHALCVLGRFRAKFVGCEHVGTFPKTSERHRLELRFIADNADMVTIAANNQVLCLFGDYQLDIDITGISE
jgi:hypothetical protein